MRHSFLIRTVFMVVLTAGGMPSQASYAPDVERGFRLLYEIRFAEARSEFLAWEKEQPTDPLRHAWEAAGYLFEEFYHHDMLTSGFFLDDRRLLGGVESTSNDEYRTGFLAASKSAQDLAKQRLASNPKDPDALFALTITTGLQANYAFLVEKRNLESLKLMRQAQRYAKDLLAIRPECDRRLPAAWRGQLHHQLSSRPQAVLPPAGWDQRRQRAGNDAARNSRAQGALSPAVCENPAGPGGPAREAGEVGTHSTRRADRGIPRKSFVCARTHSAEEVGVEHLSKRWGWAESAVALTLVLQPFHPQRG